MHRACLCCLWLATVLAVPSTASCQQWPPPIDPEYLLPREELPFSPWGYYANGAVIFSGSPPFKMVHQLDADLLIYQGGSYDWNSLVSADKEFISGYDGNWAPPMGFRGSRESAQSPLKEWVLASGTRRSYDERMRRHSREYGLFLYDLISCEVTKLPATGSFSSPRWGNDGKMYLLYAPDTHEDFFWSEEGREQVAKAKREGIWYWGQTLARVDENGTVEKLVELPSNPDWTVQGYHYMPVRNAYGLLSVSPDCKYAVLDASRLLTRDILYLVCIPEKKIIEIPTKGGTFSPRTCWSPDGKELAFSDGDGVHIVSPADLTKKRTILPPAIKGGSKTFSCGHADSWSPDGKWIVIDGGLYNQGWFLLSPDGATRKDILRKFVRHRYPDDSYDFCFPQGIAYSTWSKDGRFLAGCVMQGQIYMKGGKIQDGYSWRYFLLADLEKQEFAMYWHAGDYYYPLLLFENGEVIEKIKKARVPENDKYYATQFEAWRKKFREGAGNKIVSHAVIHDEEKWNAYEEVLNLSYGKEWLGKEFREKLLAWLKENKKEFSNIHEMLKKRGWKPQRGMVLPLDEWIRPIPEE